MFFGEFQGFLKSQKIIFVHGCFWHMHKCRYGRVIPKTNKKFWKSKREGNVARDKRNLRQLRKAGWKVLKVWECQTRNLDKLIKKLEQFLSKNPHNQCNP
jgi:DNA mismatch endonuclease (patch repair protein)